MKRVALIVGSASDWETMRHAHAVLRDFKIPLEKLVVSAHRTPRWMFEFATGAAENEFGCIIAGAGGAAHLPGMVASLTSLPVLGVPMPSGPLQGIDALLSIVQMPAGVPTATFAIGRAGAINAAVFVVRMYAVNSPPLQKKLAGYVRAMEVAARASTKKLTSRA